MKNFTVVQYQILSQFQIEHIQLFKEQFFIKLNKLVPSVFG
ncbi:ST50 protein [Escherichia coli DEC1D]|nr:ST50 protein [Escherichia coli DEC1D]